MKSAHQRGSTKKLNEAAPLPHSKETSDAFVERSFLNHRGECVYRARTLGWCDEKWSRGDVLPASRLRFSV